MKYMFAIVSAGLVAGSISAAAKKDTKKAAPTFYLKNNSDRYIKFNFKKSNGSYVYTTFQPSDAIAPKGLNGLYTMNKMPVEVDGIEIQYCDSKDIKNCLSKNRLSYKMRFLPATDTARTYYLKFDVDEKNANPTLKAQKGVGIFRHTNDDFKYSLRHNIEDKDMVLDESEWFDNKLNKNGQQL